MRRKKNHISDWDDLLMTTTITYSRETGLAPESRRCERPDLTGCKIDGIIFESRIGRGGFGDVYISKNHDLCFKVVFEQNCPRSFAEEKETADFIADKISKYCGLMKIMLSSDYGILPWPIPEKQEFSHFLMTNMHHSESVLNGYRFFYYGMAAADDLKVADQYVPDTLGNRLRHNRLEEFSNPRIFSICMEVLDALLFLYKNIHIAHGDVKPDNIFLVNGHASLGDFGCTMDIHNATQVRYESPAYAPEPDLRKKWERQTDGEYFAQRILGDLFVLGRTARALMVQNEENNPVDDIFLCSGVSESELHQLISFCKEVCHPWAYVTADILIDMTKSFRNRFLGECNEFSVKSCIAQRQSYAS